MLTGSATPEGTARFAARFGGNAAPDHFTRTRGLHLSSLGLGTYLGKAGEEDDRATIEAVKDVLTGGCNVLDTAINYRFQRSERNVGAAISDLVAGGEVGRDEIFIATKGGFVPYDGDYPRSPEDYIRETLVEPGILAESDLVAGCHSLAPGFIDHQFESSRRNLGVETIDLYHLHNPETQYQELERFPFIERLTAAFEVLERKVAAGRLRWYGTATWDGYRVPPGGAGHLSLEEVIEAARAAAVSAGTGASHFAGIQLPLNLAMPEALLAPTQQRLGGAGSPVPLLASAAARDLMVMTSASILQGHLSRQLPEELMERIPGGTSRAQKALQWVRSAPGVTTALVGMKSRSHREENLALVAVPRMSREEMKSFLGAQNP